MQSQAYQLVRYQANIDQMLLDIHICSSSSFHRPTEQQQFCPAKTHSRSGQRQPLYLHGLRRHLDFPISNQDHARRDSRLPFIFTAKLFLARKHSFQRSKQDWLLDSFVELLIGFVDFLRTLQDQVPVDSGLISSQFLDIKFTPTAGCSESESCPYAWPFKIVKICFRLHQYKLSEIMLTRKPEMKLYIRH